MKIRMIWVSDVEDWEGAFLFYSEDEYRSEKYPQNWGRKVRDAHWRFPQVRTCSVEVSENALSALFDDPPAIKGEVKGDE